MNTTSLLQEIRNLDPEVQRRVRAWLELNFDDQTKQEIAHLIESDREALVDAFYSDLTFGTGGMRGLMGVGTNRMNIYTVRWATQGLANYLKTQYEPTAQLRCAIGYDSRHNSKRFAEECARVMAGNGIEVFLYSEIRPTPLVSFACRYHHCHTAIMVTASHNAPAYNGYKVYWSDGAQVLPPHDVGIMTEVERLTDPDQVKLAPFSLPLIHLMKKELDAAYLDAITPLQLWPEQSLQEGSSLKILYSSLHGTGITMVPAALMRFGFTNLGFVDEQIIPDGDFPTCKKPNPEERAALELGIQKMLQEGYELYIATDPDADRLGVVVRHKNEAVALTGNQIVCLAAEYICQALVERQAMPQKAAFVKTIVTSELFRHIVEGHKASCFDVLTGFKYIAEKIREWQSEPNSYQFVFGGEESYGCLLGTVVRDKDAVIASCVIAEIALYAKKQNKTLLDLLDDIYLRYGMFCEYLVSVEFAETKEGKDDMQRAMQKLRNAPLPKIINNRVVKVADLLESRWHTLATNSYESISLPKADVLIYELEDGSRVVVRPSGTEPRVKVYVLSKEKTEKMSQKELGIIKAKAQAKAASLGNEVKMMMRGQA